MSDDTEAAIGALLDAEDYSGATREILRGYGVEIMGYLVAITRDPQLADDVFSTTAEDLWRGLPGFRREASVRTWLYRVAWHALQRHRKDPFRRRRTPLDPELERLAQDVRTRTATFMRTHVKDAVAKLREELSPDEQTLLVLRIDRGLSWRDVAEVMSTDEQPVSEALLAKRFQRVKAKLRALAEAAGLIPRD